MDIKDISHLLKNNYEDIIEERVVNLSINDYQIFSYIREYIFVDGTNKINSRPQILIETLYELSEIDLIYIVANFPEMVLYIDNLTTDILLVSYAQSYTLEKGVEHVRDYIFDKISDDLKKEINKAKLLSVRYNEC